jgi:hypothetical protein
VLEKRPYLYGRNRHFSEKPSWQIAPDELHALSRNVRAVFVIAKPALQAASD